MKIRLFVGQNFEFDFLPHVGVVTSLQGSLPLGLRYKDNKLSGKIHPRCDTAFYNLNVSGQNNKILIEFNICESRNSYTHNNHLQYGYGPHLKSWVAERPTTFKWVFGRPERLEIGSMLEEGIAAAKLIAERANGKPIACLMSGGIDSDALAYCFHKAGIPFQPINFRYLIQDKYINDFDFQFVEPLCKKMGYRSPLHLDINASEIFNDENIWLSYVENYLLHKPEFVLLLKGIERTIELGYFPVLSGTGTLYFPRFWAPPLPNGQFQNPPFLLHDSFFSYHRLFEALGVDGVGHFMYYTPELFYAQLQNKFLRSLVESNKPTFYDERVAHYCSGDMLVDKKPDKYNGFEELYRAYYYTTSKMFYGDFDSPTHLTDLYFKSAYSLKNIKQILEFDLEGLKSNPSFDVEYCKTQQILEPTDTIDIVALQILKNKDTPLIKPTGFEANSLVSANMVDIKNREYNDIVNKLLYK